MALKSSASRVRRRTPMSAEDRELEKAVAAKYTNFHDKCVHEPTRWVCLATLDRLGLKDEVTRLFERLGASDFLSSE